MSVATLKNFNLWISTLLIVIAVPMTSLVAWYAPWQWLVDVVTLFTTVVMVPLTIYSGISTVETLDDRCIEFREYSIPLVMVGTPGGTTLAVWLFLEYILNWPMINWPYYLWVASCGIAILGVAMFFERGPFRPDKDHLPSGGL